MKDDTVPNNRKRVSAGAAASGSSKTIHIDQSMPRLAEAAQESPWEVRACGTRPGDNDAILQGARPVLAGPPQTSARPTVLNEPMPRLSGDRYDLLRRLGSGGVPAL